MKIVSLASHPSNTDPAALIVAGHRLCWWTIYRDSKGYLLTIHGGRCVEDHYATQDEAELAAETSMILCPPGDGYEEWS